MTTGEARHLDLRSGPTRSTICTRGAGLVGLDVDGEEVIARSAEGPCHAAQYRGVVLAPWPNRVEPTYTFGGRTLHLPVNDAATGAALHGLVAHRVWEVTASSRSHVAMEVRLGEDAGYPFPVTLTATHRVIGDGVQAAVRAHNAGTAPAPVGLGVHPYLTTGLGVDDTVLQIPAEAVLVLGPRGVPTAPPRPVEGTELDHREGRRIGATELDHAFTDLRPDAGGGVEVTLDGEGGRRVVLRAEGEVRCVMVYTSDTLGGADRRAAIAVEPMTCPPGALVTGDGLTVLQPGEDLELRWSVRAPRPA